jgi:hypothetical protein
VRVRTPHTWSEKIRPQDLVDLTAVPTGSLFLTRFVPQPPVRFRVVCMNSGVALVRLQTPTPAAAPPGPG